MRPRPSRPTARPAQIKRQWRTIATAFVAVALALAGLIAYLSFNRTTITVSLRAVSRDITFSLPLAEVTNETPRLIATDVTVSETFDELTTVTMVDDFATGTVTIHNEYSTSQPLVETTRLLSSDGVLFRTQRSVTVPAGGQIDVAVRADQSGETGDLGPTRFTIPGLWTGLQDKIYAQSTEPMRGGRREIKTATEAQMEQAKEASLTAAKAAATDELAAAVSSEQRERLGTATFTVTEVTASAQAGGEMSELTVTTSLHALAPVVDMETIRTLVDEHFVEEAEGDWEVAGSGPTITTTLENVLEESEQATLTIAATADTLVTPEHPLLSPASFVGRTSDDITSSLRGSEEIESVTVSFSPFWVRHVPKTTNAITVVIDRPALIQAE